MANKKKANGGGNHMVVYPYYRHTGQDPMVQKVLSAVSQATNEKPGARATKAKVSPTTIQNWRKKKTRRPQHATMAAYAGAYGLVFELVEKK